MTPVVLRIRYHGYFQRQMGNQILFTRSGHPWPSTAGQISQKPSLKNTAAFYGISLPRHAKEQKSSGFDKTHRQTSCTGSIQALFVPQAAFPELKSHRLIKNAGCFILAIHRQHSNSKTLALQIGEPDKQKLPAQSSPPVIWIDAQHIDAASTFARGFLLPKLNPRPTITNGFI